jgi:hypothetical protein
MKYFKKFAASLLVGGIAALVPTAGHAFTSKQVTTETAAATVSGGVAQMTVSVLTLAGAPATNVAWPAVSAGSSWTEASDYIQILSTLTVAGAGVQTYTNNTISGANPRYTGAVSTSTSAGLVNTGLTTQAIPMAWQIVANGASPVAVDDPNHLVGTGYAWFYYADKAGGLLANADAGDTYIEPESAGNPPQIQFAQSSFGNSASNTNNLYLEANFLNATGGSTYQTSTLTVELYTN